MVVFTMMVLAFQLLAICPGLMLTFDVLENNLTGTRPITIV